MSESLKELLARGYRERKEKRLPESRAAFIEAVREAAIEADRSALAEALCGLAQAEHDIGNLAASSHHYETSAILYRQLKLPTRLAYALRHQADTLRENQRPLEAEPLYLEAESIYRNSDVEAPVSIANTLRGLALVNESTGRPDAAKVLWREARELYARSGVTAGVEECDGRLRA